jgi:hypothetical protein
MTNQLLLNVLIEDMKSQAKSEEEINKFIEYFKSIRDHNPYPCPRCFFEGVQGVRLSALNAENGFEPVKCNICKSKFFIPIPH